MDFKVKQPTIHQQQQHRTTIIPIQKKPWGEVPSFTSTSRVPQLTSINGQQQVNQFNGQQQQRRWGKGATSYRESSLLGDLHVDKIYLERLLENPGKEI